MRFSSPCSWWDYPLAQVHPRSFLRPAGSREAAGVLVPWVGGSRRGDLREALTEEEPPLWPWSPQPPEQGWVNILFWKFRCFPVEVGLTFTKNWEICHEVWVSMLFWNILSQKSGSWQLWACACSRATQLCPQVGLRSPARGPMCSSNGFRVCCSTETVVSWGPWSSVSQGRCRRFAL